MAKKKGCFSCGKGFSGDTRQLLLKYKQDKKDVYFFKKVKDGDIFIVKKEHFKEVFKTQIKPNFKKGAEYAHITEFKG
jgi:hypothetical protein